MKNKNPSLSFIHSSIHSVSFLNQFTFQDTNYTYYTYVHTSFILSCIWSFFSPLLKLLEKEISPSSSHSWTISFNSKLCITHVTHTISSIQFDLHNSFTFYEFTSLQGNVKLKPVLVYFCCLWKSFVFTFKFDQPFWQWANEYCSKGITSRIYYFSFPYFSFMNHLSLFFYLFLSSSFSNLHRLLFASSCDSFEEFIWKKKEKINSLYNSKRHIKSKAFPLYFLTFHNSNKIWWSSRYQPNQTYITLTTVSFKKYACIFSTFFLKKYHHYFLHFLLSHQKYIIQILNQILHYLLSDWWKFQLASCKTAFPRIKLSSYLALYEFNKDFIRFIFLAHLLLVSTFSSFITNMAARVLAKLWQLGSIFSSTFQVHSNAKDLLYEDNMCDA